MPINISLTEALTRLSDSMSGTTSTTEYINLQEQINRMESLHRESRSTRRHNAFSSSYSLRTTHSQSSRPVRPKHPSTLKRITMAYNELQDEFFPNLKVTSEFRNKKNDTIAYLVKRVDATSNRTDAKFDCHDGRYGTFDEPVTSQVVFNDTWIDEI